MNGDPAHLAQGVAAFLDVHLGIDDIVRRPYCCARSRPQSEGDSELGAKRRVADQTAAERFLSFREVHTTAWCDARDAVAQSFLNAFVRQNVAEIDEIKLEDRFEPVHLSAPERAICLELDHHLSALEINACV